VVVVLPNGASESVASAAAPVDHLFHHSAMAAQPKRSVTEWVTVSEEHNIYVADTGLTMEECDRIVAVTEHVCRGQYAAYTYAKQTLGCREFPALASTVQDAVHTITHAILEFNKKNNINTSQARSRKYSPQSTAAGDSKSDKPSSSPPATTPMPPPSSKPTRLALDDREPHMVKYDVTKKERQKLDMHTDKSEWTFLISLSNGCGLDYAGGGTYFECLDSTVHIQRGHALVFPGKLRHCGQRITAGLRFLLVGFLVDKTPPPPKKVAAAGDRSASKTSEDSTTSSQQQQYIQNIP
jgi:hypothetical protein